MSQCFMRKNFTAVGGLFIENSSWYESFSLRETCQNTLWNPSPLWASTPKQEYYVQPPSTNTWNVITNISTFMFTLAEGQARLFIMQANRKYFQHAPSLSQHQHDAAHFALMTTEIHTSVHRFGLDGAKSCHPQGMKFCQEWQWSSSWMITTRRWRFFLFFQCSCTLIHHWDTRWDGDLSDC